MDIYKKIIKGVSHVHFSYNTRDADAMDLVKNLLRHNPAERIPMRHGGTENLKRHACYRGFDWKGLYEQTVKPPYVPELKSSTDMANFKGEKAELPPQIAYKDPGTGWDQGWESTPAMMC